MINERHSKEPSSSISTKSIQNSSFISDLLGCEYFVSNNVGCNNLWKKWNSVCRIILFCDNKTCLKQVSKSKGLFPHTQSLFYKVFLRTHFFDECLPKYHPPGFPFHGTSSGAGNLPWISQFVSCLGMDNKNKQWLHCRKCQFLIVNDFQVP